MRPRVLRDERGIVVSWLLKLLVSIAIVGLVAFEAGAILVAHVSADSAASDAAGVAAFVVALGGNDRSAQNAANEAAAKDGAKLISFAVAADGKTVTVTIEKTARTMIVQRISQLRSWGVIRTTRKRAVVA
jgi:hypothetical protein